MEDPIDELRKIIEQSGSDVETIFGPALTIFAGNRAAARELNEKLGELERLISQEPQ
ncbi:MAG: hypothetical protein KGS60_12600 [Verrucomicrobia bacterium]|nr:hypothetical protein [Verrucomicrobiota bacterium]